MEYFDIVVNTELLENAVMSYDLYSSIKFSEDKQVYVCLCPDETYSLDSWLMKKITGDDRSMISFFELDQPQTKVGRNLNSIEKSPAIIDEEKGTLTVRKRNISLDLDFKAGEELDFKNLDVASLFLDHDLMKILAHTEIVDDTEKEALFKKDFEFTFQDGEDFYQFYKLNPDIRVKTKYELDRLTRLYRLKIDVISDEEGYIICVYFCDYYMISQDEVTKIQKYATLLSV